MLSTIAHQKIVIEIVEILDFLRLLSKPGIYTLFPSSISTLPTAQV